MDEIQVTFRINTAGRPVSDWVLHDLTLWEPGGRRLSLEECNVIVWPPRGGAQRAELAPVRPPASRRGAWRVELEVLRAGHFPPESRLTLPGVAVPEPGETLHPGCVARRGRMTVRLAEIARGVEAPRRSDDPFNSRALRLHLQVSPPVENLELSLIRAVDQEGRPCEGARPYPMGWTQIARRRSERDEYPPGACRFGVGIPAGARTLDLTFAAHRSRFFRFGVRPHHPAALPELWR